MFVERYRRKLKLQHKSGLYRNPPVIDRREDKYIYSGGERLLNMASNDYLGLGESKSLREKVAENFSRYGTSSSSSRLVSANFKRLAEAEKAYAQFFGFEAALFYPSGYQANLGVLSTLFEPGDTILYDKHIHASSVKGLALSGAKIMGFNHSKLSHLDKRLQKIDGQAAVVVESLYSMDGDCLDLAGLTDLKKQYGFFTVVDEAHAFGVLGAHGRGLAAEAADVAVGTFGKALGLFGAFAVMPREVKSYLLNFSSPQIYTTALPEAHAASAMDVLAAIDKRDADRQHLKELGRWLKQELEALGFQVSGDAHILGVLIGDERKALAMAGRLFSHGIFVLPARYPTVPLDRAILRISLTTRHTHADGRMVVAALKEAFEADG